MYLSISTPERAGHERLKLQTGSDVFLHKVSSRILLHVKRLYHQPDWSELRLGTQIPEIDTLLPPLTTLPIRWSATFQFRVFAELRPLLGVSSRLFLQLATTLSSLKSLFKMEPPWKDQMHSRRFYLEFHLPSPPGARPGGPPLCSTVHSGSLFNCCIRITA